MAPLTKLLIVGASRSTKEVVPSQDREKKPYLQRLKVLAPEMNVSRPMGIPAQLKNLPTLPTPHIADRLSSTRLCTAARPRARGSILREPDSTSIGSLPRRTPVTAGRALPLLHDPPWRPPIQTKWQRTKPSLVCNGSTSCNIISPGEDGQLFPSQPCSFTPLRPRLSTRAQRQARPNFHGRARRTKDLSFRTGAEPSVFFYVSPDIPQAAGASTQPPNEGLCPNVQPAHWGGA